MNTDLRKVKDLRKEIVDQLINGDWDSDSSYNNFKNSYFHFLNFNNNSGWEIRINGDYGSSRNLSDFIPIWKFLLLRFFYVIPKIKNKKKQDEIKRLASISESFFKLNKDKKRDNRIKEILN